jgi:hypothetical protein
VRRLGQDGAGGWKNSKPQQFLLGKNMEIKSNKSEKKDLGTTRQTAGHLTPSERERGKEKKVRSAATTTSFLEKRPYRRPHAKTLARLTHPHTNLMPSHTHTHTHTKRKS